MKKKQITSENLIHIKFDYNETVEAKKDLLQTEIHFLRLAQKVKLYQILRKKELSAKIKLKGILRGAKTNLSDLQSILPKIQTTNIKTSILNPDLIKKSKEENNYDKSLENELREIQNKLNALQQ